MLASRSSGVDRFCRGLANTWDCNVPLVMKGRLGCLLEGGPGRVCLSCGTR